MRIGYLEYQRQSYIYLHGHRISYEPRSLLHQKYLPGSDYRGVVRSSDELMARPAHRFQSEMFFSRIHATPSAQHKISEPT